MKADSGRILVVDDQGVNRMFMAHYLEEYGFEVATAATCEEALEALSTRDYDLLLLDIVMPGMGGLELLRNLREQYTLTELPIIMATARNESADVVEALNLGANDYITKPVDIPVAVARIRTHLHLRLMDRRLRESEERYALAVRGANEGLWDWDLRSDRVYFSPRFKLILGAEEEAMGSSPREWFGRLHPEDRERFQEEIRDHLRGSTPHLESQHRVVLPDGAYRWVLARGLAVRDEAGEVHRMAGSLSDITTSQMYDNATGLPGRQLLLDALERSLARVGRKNELLFGVLEVGIDQFDLLLAGLGPSEGDRLLSHVGRRLQLASRASDTVARLEGSRFGVMLEDLRHVSDALRVASRIRRSLRDPIPVADQPCRVTASVGISLSASGYERPEHLLRDAHTAMSQARARGGDRHEIFDRAIHQEAEERIQLEDDLRQALEGHQFVLLYQPILGTRDGLLAGFEALVRWRHPQRGMLPPEQFLPICDLTGLTVPLGTWVLQTAAEQAHRWQQMHPALADLSISVNLSALQLVQPDLVPTLARILRDSHLAPGGLRLEVTETMLMHRFEPTVGTLLALQDLGIQLVMDDFGTGHSSLSRLHRFPIRYLKVDQSFVSRVETDEEAWETVRLIVNMARHLGKQTIAEGVETPGQFDILKGLGVDYAQGFLYSPPVEADRAGSFLEARVSGAPWSGAPA